MKHTLIVALDALLDTRLATISKINQEAAVKLLKDDGYYHRQIDDFEALTGIHPDVYHAAYAQRDVDTLKRSMMTVIPILLKNIVDKMENEVDHTPHVDSVTLEINTWPYHLTADQSDFLVTALLGYSGINTMPTIVHRSPKELSPEHCYEHYTGMIFYDWAQWMDIHKEALLHKPMPRVTIVAPALYLDRVPEIEETIIEGLPPATPFMFTEMAWVEHMKLELLSPELFSILRLDRPLATEAV